MNQLKINQDLKTWATWREIQQQPDVWRNWAQDFDPAPVRAWVDALGIDEIWLSGAGTSAYTGEIIAAGLVDQQAPAIRAVASTDIVAQPAAYLAGRRPLIVSFGRSGNSAESVGVMQAMDKYAPEAPRLNITCNPTSALATWQASGPQKTILLPEAAHDHGFAMTSSFSTMLYTALGIFDRTTDFAAALPALGEELDRHVSNWAAAVPEMPERIVFFGIGPLAQAARESGLKVLELTAGAVATSWESTLGFRHGPKSFINENTLVVAYMSSSEPGRQYDLDLVAEVRRQYPKTPLITVGQDADVTIDMSRGDLWSAPVVVAYAQTLATIWSHRMELNVDDPFAGQGTLTRVVQDVTLHGLDQ